MSINRNVHSHQNKERKVKVGKKRNEPIRGVIAITSRGSGYVSVEGFKEDIEIHREALNTALHKDEVEVALLPVRQEVKGGDGQTGEVLRVLKRARPYFVGTVEKDERGCFVVPDDRHAYIDFLLSRADTAHVETGDKILVRFIEWLDPAKNPLVELQRIIGKKGEHNAEMLSFALESGFDATFPEEVRREATILARESTTPIEKQDDFALRRDFRGTLTFTIDPDNAKDFDDALSFKKLNDDRIEVGVHIADVSHYVRPGTALDREAGERATSVYLVDRTIPMLPEALSNDLCSLNPQEDKRAFSAVFEIDKDARVEARWFGKTIIRSDRRFSYEEAQREIVTKKGDYPEELGILNELAKKIKKRRHEKGAIEFEEDEVKINLDAQGKPIAIRRKERLDAHKLIEEFMLLANREVAEYIWRLEQRERRNKPFVYRIHDVPNQEKITELGIYLKALGHELKVSKQGVTSKELNALFEKIRGHAAEGLIKTATIRTMAKAIYSTDNKGHFGLAFKYYTHFTSPIRRYPDLLVHRQLEQYLLGNHASAEDLARSRAQALHASRREVEAMEAERASIKYKQVEYMLSHIGEEFDAIISGVTEWGIYVEDTKTRAEGMVRARDLPNDWYELDAKNYRLVGERSKKKFTLGDRARVKLTAADLDRRTLDFALV